MDHIKLTAWNTGKIIFAGRFQSMKACLEAAINAGVALDYLFLQDQAIGPANLDGGSFSHARFTRCDLRGANLSEASLVKAHFIDCRLNDACLSDSAACGARFLGSDMKGCEVAFADLRRALVSCPEFLKGDFQHSTHLGGAAFCAEGLMCPMNRIPVFIHGLGLDVFLLDEHIVLGRIVLHRDQLGRDKDGMAGAFARQGLALPELTLERLWRAVRDEAETKRSIAA